MCEQHDEREAEMRAAIEEVSREEGVPLLCSAPECRRKPAVRWSPNPDTAEPLCVECLVGVGVWHGVRELQAQLARAGVVLCGDGVAVLSAVTGRRLASELEVL